ncbi:hypothetical protein [Nitriliruptor alkaliphilus]|uniref:hypothetical protein n=1 Tax=Nitriliruptor alkaliphilus TaxID=427918 RepID=UPI00146FF7D6|nr:hypothetical protein [Nitriliruptor alkaliphilus]
MDTLFGAFPFVFVLLFGGLAIAATYWQYHRKKLLREGAHRLAARDGLQLTETPGGLSREQYAGRFDATPRGDRRNGLRYGVQGPTTVELGGHPVRIEVACFEWWHEVRHQNQKGSNYSTTTTTVAVARLPVAVPGRVTIKPEGILGRIGLRRSDQQVESEEFNRRFNVSGSDPRFTLKLLDASMQHRLLTSATGRTIHLERDLLVLGGSPSHRDASLPGVIGELPAVAQDIIGLLRTVPAQVWRTASPVSGPGGPA